MTDLSSIPVQATDEAVDSRAESNGLDASNTEQEVEEPPQKRARLEAEAQSKSAVIERKKGVAPIKAEYLVNVPGSSIRDPAVNDDAAEAAGRIDPGNGNDRKTGRRKKNSGQNTKRDFGVSQDERGLCASRSWQPEFSPGTCPFGENCKYEHALRTYLEKWKRKDLATFDGKCPVIKSKGKCPSGWKCRFVGSHMLERETADGRKELCLIDGTDQIVSTDPWQDDQDPATFNVPSKEVKLSLAKKKVETPKADKYNKYIEDVIRDSLEQERSNRLRQEGDETIRDTRAEYREPPFLPSEKRRIYFGPETPVLAPLTTQGNLPFRRLCVDLGAQLTYSEMAMSMPLIQGHKSEWALMRAHESEVSPPQFRPGSSHIVEGYDNARDLKFGAQIAANKPYMALKASEILADLCPRLRVIDLNCGCPIDLVFNQGAGSALLDSQGKLEKILRGMNAVSGEIPITTKIRMGTKDGKPNALKIVDRMVFGHDGLEPSGVAAITLHGRSRQQRYSRSADWEYIASCAAMINEHRKKGDMLADTAQEADPRYQSASKQVYFVGNGDCYSHVDYYDNLGNSKVDAIMVARGALIKPWLFEEIEKGQYLDKSATERLALVEQYVRYGLETWGSDEVGIGFTRRFLLEWLSFAHRYIPVGLLEYLPPSIQDRPPAWRGRNELETLLGSDNYKDWIKISEMFLGPAAKDFNFEPKHRSNAYEIQAEG